LELDHNVFKKLTSCRRAAHIEHFVLFALDPFIEQHGNTFVFASGFAPLACFELIVFGLAGSLIGMS
jgi:hypothetical protein